MKKLPLLIVKRNRPTKATTESKNAMYVFSFGKTDAIESTAKAQRKALIVVLAEARENIP